MTQVVSDIITPARIFNIDTATNRLLGLGSDTVEGTWSYDSDLLSSGPLTCPHEIVINGTTDGTDSNGGTYGYDGSGNITTIAMP